MLRKTILGDVIRFDLARTMLGRGRYWTTAYLVGDTLVDSGCAHTSQELVAALGDAKIERIINTHTHEDHIGANGVLQRLHPGLEVLAHPLALAVLHDPRGQQPLHPYRKVMWGWPEPCPARALADGDIVDAGRHHFQVVFTPGHAADHLCLFEPEQGWLFTGDLFVGGKDRALRQDCDIWTIIDSLHLIAELPATVIFPGCAKVRTNPAEAIAAKLEHLQSFGERVLTLHDDGRSVGQIVGELSGPRMFIELFTLGHFTRRHLVRSYLTRAG